MKILMIPECSWRAGQVWARQCERCRKRRAHLRLFPQSVPVPLEALDPGDESVAVAALVYVSKSGLTYCMPAAETGLPAVLGYRDHRMILPVIRPVVVPAELVGGWATPVATFRDVFRGVKAAYAVASIGEFRWSWPPELIEEEAACPACRVELARQATQVATQGRLSVLPREAVPGWEGWRGQEQTSFFNHRVSAGGYCLVRGRFASLEVGSIPTTITSPDHPAEPIELGQGQYWLFHPWPSPDGGVD